MTDLSREHIEYVREDARQRGERIIYAICNAALREKTTEYGVPDELRRLPTFLRARAVTANDREGVRDARKAFHIAADDVERAVNAALLQPTPPESEPCKTCNGTGVKTWRNERWGVPDEVASCKCPDCDAPHTPEQAPYRKKAMDSDAVLERAARQAHESLRHVHRALGADAHPTPEQAHGDALAAFEEVMADFQELTGIDPNANPKVRQVRQALTASGVPDHWACKNPGRADQYRAEAMACRRALGFSEDSEDVSPNDLTSAIADSGVPEKVRRLWYYVGNPSAWETYDESVSQAIEAALDSAPADGWKLVPVEPTEKMLAELITSTGTDDARRDPVGIMRPNYQRMIAAAPQRGGEK